MSRRPGPGWMGAATAALVVGLAYLAGASLSRTGWVADPGRLSRRLPLAKPAIAELIGSYSKAAYGEGPGEPIRPGPIDALGRVEREVLRTALAAVRRWGEREG